MVAEHQIWQLSSQVCEVSSRLHALFQRQSARSIVIETVDIIGVHKSLALKSYLHSSPQILPV
jgi:hypothetical protein